MIVDTRQKKVVQYLAFVIIQERSGAAVYLLGGPRPPLGPPLPRPRPRPCLGPAAPPRPPRPPRIPAIGIEVFIKQNYNYRHATSAVLRIRVFLTGRIR